MTAEASARGAVSAVDGWVLQSQAEAECVAALRGALRDLAPEQDATHNLSDEVLVRFARARRNNARQAEKLYRATAEWRKKERPVELAGQFEPCDLIRKYRPGGFLGCDKMGCPVFYDRIGRADPAVLKWLKQAPAQGRDASPGEQLAHFEVQKMEVLTAVFEECSRKQGRPIYQQLVVQDLRGLGTHHLQSATLEVVQSVLGVLDDYYPLRFRKVIIVYPPFIFSMAWAIISKFVHESTREQVEVVSGDPAKKLLEYIDAEQLPKALGGKLVIDGSDYCESIIIPGGRIDANERAGRPSVYHAQSKGLPVQRFVPTRQSVRFGAPLKAKTAALDAGAAQPAETPQQPEAPAPEPGSYQEYANQVAAQASELYEELVKYVSSWAGELAQGAGAPETAASSPPTTERKDPEAASAQASPRTPAAHVAVVTAAAVEPLRVAQLEPPAPERAAPRPKKGCCVIS